MKPSRSRVLFFHGLKTWAVMTVTFVPLALASDWLPSWLTTCLFWLLVVLVFFPVVFAVGPLGRRIGRPLNEMAMADAQARREALGAKPESSSRSGFKE